MVRRFQDGIGMMDWAAPMDWPCEPFMNRRTGLSVAEHQRRTVENYLSLRSKAPDLPIIPVLQGWTLDDYLRCWEQYERAGVDLTRVSEVGQDRVRLVGLGSFCRRNTMEVAEQVVWNLEAAGIQLHGFGVKLAGLAMFGDWLTTADSMAWSYTARNSSRREGCTHVNRNTGEPSNCANCLTYALEWREKVLRLYGSRQTRLRTMTGATA